MATNLNTLFAKAKVDGHGSCIFGHVCLRVHGVTMEHAGIVAGRCVAALGLLLILTGPGAVAAQEMPGAFSTPPVGTFVEYIPPHEIRIRSVEGYVVEYEWSAYAAKANRVSYGWLWDDEPWPWDDEPSAVDGINIDADALERFFPLEIGNSISFTVQIGARTLHVTYRVDRTKVLDTRAGSFATYVIAGDIVARTRNDLPEEYERTIWYAPELGLVAKFLELWPDRRSRNFEIYRVTYPADR